MKRSPYTTDIIPLNILSGASNGVTSQQVENGRIIGVALISKGGANTGMVRVKVSDQNNTEIVKLQPIEMLALRDGNFHGAFYPLNFEAKGQVIKYEVLATANFTSNFVSDLVLIYDINEDC